MKIRYLILIVVCLLITVLIYYLVYRKKIELTNIKSFHLSYTKGYAINSNVNYELKWENGKYVSTIKPYGIYDGDKLVVEVKKNINQKIIDAIKEYHVEKWDGFNKNDLNVLDGDSFSLSILMDKGNSINASGYMKWPDNYRNFVSKIDNIFMEIYHQNIE